MRCGVTINTVTRLSNVRLYQSKQTRRHVSRQPLHTSRACFSPGQLPEDPTPAMWQRVAQLVAGTTAACTLFYFVLVADFGPEEHCFTPVCQFTVIVLMQIRRLVHVDEHALRRILLPHPTST